MVVRNHLRAREVQTRYIASGAPSKNGFLGSFNTQLRDELLDRELYTPWLEAEVLCKQYHLFCGEERPHNSLSNKAPAAYAAARPESIITPEPAPTLS